MEIKKLKPLLKAACQKLENMPPGSRDIPFEVYLQQNPASGIRRFFDYFEKCPSWDDSEIKDVEEHMLCEIIRIDITDHIQIYRAVFRQLLLGIEYTQNRQLIKSIIDFYRLY